MNVDVILREEKAWLSPVAARVAGKATQSAKIAFASDP
jgi:hypothetical protein